MLDPTFFFHRILRGVVGNLMKSSFFWFALTAFFLLVGGLTITCWQWDWLRAGSSETATNGDALRNAGIILGGVLALVFALWRGWVAEQQSATAQHQADIAQRSLMNEQYERGAEMLGNAVLSVRLGGIYALRRLAEEHPEQYHIQIMELLCAFVRYPTRDSSVVRPPDLDDEFGSYMRTLRPDVQETMQAIGSRSSAGLSLEISRGSKPYMRDAHLVYLQLQDANLSRAWLTNANLSLAVLPDVDLSCARLREATLLGTHLRRANLSNAKLWCANLRGAILENANLSGTDFCGIDANSQEFGGPACGLTQAQLDIARADPNNPPKLNGVRDAETDELLVWRGRPLHHVSV